MRELPELIVSGFLDAAPHDGFGLNIVGRLPKPVRLGDLLRSVQIALDRRAHRPAEPPSQAAIASREVKIGTEPRNMKVDGGSGPGRTEAGAGRGWCS